MDFKGPWVSSWHKVKRDTLKSGKNNGNFQDCRDLTQDILSRLPVKTLSRFKTVSKDFLSYISDNAFHQLHRLQSQKNPFSLSMTVTFPQLNIPNSAIIRFSCSDRQGQPINHFAKIIDPKSSPNLLPSHHHLVCISSGDNIYICNPSTEELLPLPLDSSPGILCPAVGFGYLPSKKEYKVVKLCSDSLGWPNLYKRIIDTKILTISTDTNNLCRVFSSWRILKEKCPVAVAVAETPAFVDGVIHWKTLQRSLWDDEKILAFDLDEEKFSILSPPTSVAEKHNNFRLAEIRGNLWLAEHTHMFSIIELWVFNKDMQNPSWKKEFKIDCTTIWGDSTTIGSDNTYYASYLLHPLDFQNEEGILFTVDGIGLVLYNVKTKTFTLLKEGRDGFRFCYYIDGFLS